ncbi:MAG: nuclear transport factor 2 family protein [Actinomycetota bacterium]
MPQPTLAIEHHAIVEALQRYVDGATGTNSAIMRPSFDDRATVYSIDGDGAIAGGPADVALFDPVDNALPPSPDAQSATIHIDVVRTAASARVDTDGLAGANYTDFFHLLKVHGEWKIVSKVFHAYD